MFEQLTKINKRPKPFELYTAEDLWNDEYRARQMLQYHLNESVDISSRNHAFINKSVEWINRYFKIEETTKIADFGCGPGLYTKKLAEKGPSVTGIDFSTNSIEYARADARENKLDINYVNQNYLDFTSIEKFDLIIMIMCDFCALSPSQRKELLNMFSTYLADGGSILLDVYSLGAFDKREEASAYEKNQLFHFWSEDDYYAFVNTFKYDDEKVCLDKFSIFEKDTSYTIFNWLQYFSADSLRREFVEAGLSVTDILGDVAGAEYSDTGEEFAVVAKKGIQ